MCYKQAERRRGRSYPTICTISSDSDTLTLAFGLVQPPTADGTAEVKPVAAMTEGPSFRVICRGEPKPDMFAPNRDVIVEGSLVSNGTIEARQELTSCPSKYTPKQPQ
jgi:cytochrome c-type biogenesis protein CcmE